MINDSAHIQSYAQGGPHEVSNGILLQADLHRLYDKGYVTVTPDYEFKVSGALRDEYENGRVYYELEDRVRESGSIRLPEQLIQRPDRGRWTGTKRRSSEGRPSIQRNKRTTR